MATMTYQPHEQIRKQRDDKLDPVATAFLAKAERIRIDKLSFHPTAPMPDCLPCASDGTYLHQIPEEAGKHNRNLG